MQVRLGQKYGGAGEMPPRRHYILFSALWQAEAGLVYLDVANGPDETLWGVHLLLYLLDLLEL